MEMVLSSKVFSDLDVTKNIKHVLNFDSNEVGLIDFDAIGLFDGIKVFHYSEYKINVYDVLNKNCQYNVYV